MASGKVGNSLNISDGGVNSLLQENINSVKKKGKRSFLLPKDLEERIVQDVVNDDEFERRKRKEEAELLEKQRAAKDKVVQPKATPFNLLSNLTPIELEEHYSQCIRMCNQNKVNPKNAFKLQLIDYMKLILETRNKKTENLSLMSCTLDASAKIYSYRVDKVYSDMLKVMSGKNWTGGGDDDEDNENGENEQHCNENGDDTPKKKKKYDKNDKDNVDIEKMLWSEARLDKSEVETEITNCINYGRTPLPSNAELFFDCPFSDLNGQLSLNCDLFNFNEITPNENILNNIVPRFNGSFDKMDLTKAIPGYSEIYNDKSNISIVVNNHLVYDKDSHLIPDTLRIDDNEGGITNNLETIVDYDDYISDEDCIQEPTPISVQQPSNNIGQLSMSKLNSFSVSGLSKLVSARRSDYSFFDNSRLDFLAGPVHWSIKNKKQKVVKSIEANKKDKKDHIVKKEGKIDFSLKNLKTLHKIFAVNNKSQTLASRTIKMWCKTSYTIPVKIYDQRDIVSLVRDKKLIYLSNDFKYGLYGNSNDELEKLNQFHPENFSDDAVGGDDVDRDMFSDDDHNGLEDDHHIDLNEKENGAILESGNDSNIVKSDIDLELVPAPPMVNKIAIKYAKVQKKIDIRLLKTTMWDCMQLEKKKESKLEEEDDIKTMENSNGKREKVNLASILSTLPGKLPEEEANQLSFGLAFMALLHLANEKNLKLTGKESYDDVIIELG